MAPSAAMKLSAAPRDTLAKVISGSGAYHRTRSPERNPGVDQIGRQLPDRDRIPLENAASGENLTSELSIPERKYL
jgi:hypothetical protein